MIYTLPILLFIIVTLYRELYIIPNTNTSEGDKHRGTSELERSKK